MAFCFRLQMKNAVSEKEHVTEWVVMWYVKVMPGNVHQNAETIVGCRQNIQEKLRLINASVVSNKLAPIFKYKNTGGYLSRRVVFRWVPVQLWEMTVDFMEFRGF